MRKGKQKGICAGLALISALSVVSGCSQGSDLTIEYGEEIDLAQLLGTKEDTTFSLSVDPQTVGTLRGTLGLGYTGKTRAGR